MIRIGHGFDAHRFGGDAPLILGGVEVAYKQGVIAHSDGDVVIHAVCDALLGAAALGDIGQHFSDQDARFKDVDSRQLLLQVMHMLEQRQLSVGNLDITIVAQKPKLAEYLPAMRQVLAHDCQTTTDNINLKATTTEKMGYIGRCEGLAVHAVVVLIKR